MKKKFFKLFLFITYFPLMYFWTTQLAYFLSCHYNIIEWRKNFKVFLPWKILFWQGNNDYFKVSLILNGLLTLFFVLNLFSKSTNEQRRKLAERRLTKEERKNIKHLATNFEMLRGLQRLSFDEKANINHLENNKKLVTMAKISIYCFIINLPCMIYFSYLNIFNLIFNKLSQLHLFLLFLSIFIEMLMIVIFFISLVFSIISYKNKKINKLCYLYYYAKDFFNYCFDDIKKFINKILLFFSSSIRMNTLKKYKINGKETYFRSGIPIISKKYSIYLDASDSHSLVLGTTNSGKTQSLIAPMIMSTMIANESIVINDIKGELLPMFQDKLKEKGYNVISINFIDPQRSSLWNPLSVVIKKYRAIEKEWEERINSNSDFNKKYKKTQSAKIKMLSNFKKYLLSKNKYEKFLIQFKGSKSSAELENFKKAYNESLDKLKKSKEEYFKLKEQLPSIDYSEALEYLRDISNVFFQEKDAKNAFFWQSAQLLFEGLILYLLEYESLENDQLKKLENTKITFSNAKMLKNDLMDNKLKMDFFLLKSNKDFSMQRLKGVLDQPDTTKENIVGTFDTKIEIGTMNESIARMTSDTDFDFHDLGTKPTALFIGVHDEKETYYPFVTILIKQIYEELVKTARENSKQRLPIPLNIIWDEFGISPALKNIDNMLSAMRFRGIRMTMVIQDFSQLDEKYGKNVAAAIKNNVMNQIYLLAGEKATLEDISYKAGKKLMWNKDTNKFDYIPVMPPERLSLFQYGEALILSQRKFPIYTHLLPFTKYGYYNDMVNRETILPSKRELPEIDYFFLSEEAKKITKK